jgi:subtilase family serine protease
MSLVVASACTAALLVGSTAPAMASTDAGSAPLVQNVLPGLAAAQDRGAAPAETPMELVVTIARPDPAGEQALLAATHNPSSHESGRFLSAGEFADRFGVPTERVDAVTGWLRAGGLRVASISSARDQIAVTGTAAAISRRFEIPIHRFDSRDGTFMANTAPPRVPVGSGVINVVGLNTAQRMRPFTRPEQSGCAGHTCIGGTTPANLWAAYQQPGAFTGHSQRVAIFGYGPIDGVISDLRLFEKRSGLAEVPVRVVRPPDEHTLGDESGRIEWNLDTQAASGMAPDLDRMDLYFGDSLSDVEVTHLFSMFTDDENSPLQASASFGECERVPAVSPLARQPLLNPPAPVAQGLGNDLDATLTTITRQAALEGKTIFVSSGDTGSSCPAVVLPVVGAGNGVLNQAVPLTNSPASLPWVVAVGGTVLYTDRQGHRDREYGWPYSGGGSTQFITAPDYQRDTRGMFLHCLTQPGELCRGVPDVAAQSGDITGNGYDIVTRGRVEDGRGSGTSLSSPLWAGMWARIQSASARPGGLGFANYAIYRLGNDPATYQRDFVDITSTDLRTGAPSVNGLYPSAPGWDYVTGFGTPRVTGLICDLTGHC